MQDTPRSQGWTGSPRSKTLSMFRNNLRENWEILCLPSDNMRTHQEV
jgi:hypothetical protein